MPLQAAKDTRIVERLEAIGYRRSAGNRLVVSKWLERFRWHWEERLGQLDDYLRELQEKGEER